MSSSSSSSAAAAGGGAEGAAAAPKTHIKPAASAFLFFQRERQSKIKAELEAKGEAHGLGDVQKALSAQWKGLGDEERGKFEALAAEDRARYEAECAEADRIAEEESARRRKEREEVVLESRMRERAPVEEKVARAPRAKRELTEEEAEERRRVKEEKAARQAIVDAEHKRLADEHAKQAEARLSYLLKQSDIFTHFGLTSGGGKGKKSEAASAAAAGGGAKHRRAEAEGGDDDEMGEEHEAHFLLKQPSVIKNGELRAYQLEGLNWMIRLQDNGINGILADEMGLGKTLQSISVLAYNHEFLNVDGPHLILVPKSTLANWCNEFRKWCPVLRVLRFHGSKDERAEIVAEHLQVGVERDWDVLITTYEICNLEKMALSRFAWQYLIIDEAHRLKNEASQFSQTVRMLQTAHRLLITGTPLQNNLHELWALLNFLLPEVFGSAEQFDEWFNLQIDDAEQKQRLITQLHKILRPFMLRRLKADVETSLPKKTETLVFCEMSPLQRETYKKILERDLSVIAGTESTGRTAILNIVMQLRKACNHPYLFTGVEDRTLDPLGDHVVTNCGKMFLLDKLLKKLKEKGHRVLVFCQMTRMLDILEDFMVMRGHAYCRIDGNTSYEERENLIDTYNAPDSPKFAFLLSTRAGGLGINLQTADTVILYDSDWNPQADLQAQDRAHRIGQKKPVNIYRLVTQGTIEEKIVERAQKKLKLDAMVVQQGRLQDKDKMSKDELLEALRFGADVIFRSKDNQITDEDIDLILERGRKRTAEMEEKLKAADKGDLLDFRMDGGMSAQVFEGQDYSKSRTKDQGLLSLPQLHMFDIGKRERKPTQSNLNEGALLKRMVADGDGRKRQNKMPKQLRLPRIDDNWMFFQRDRLKELQKREEDRYRELKNADELPNDPKEWQLLPPELAEEKARLLAEGFGDWTKNHFSQFVKASAKYGRSTYDKIAVDVGKSEEEVARYASVFWEKGEKELADAEWKKIVNAVEKGEKKLEDIARLTKATQELVARFKNPWEELTFQYAGQQGKERVYSSEEDRYLLCFTNHYGYGNWEDVRMAIRRCDRFRFDYFLRSCNADTLGKRCEQLMRAAEKENVEYERKRAAVDEGRRKEKEDRLLEESRREKEEEERRKKLGEIDARLAEEEARLQELADAKRVAEQRLQMLKGSKLLAGSSGNGGAGNGGGDALSASSSSIGGSAKAKAASSSASTAGKDRDRDSTGGGQKGIQPRNLPDELLPEMARSLVASGTEGVARLVTEFYARWQKTGVSKRQIEMKIGEIGIKEKRDGDARPVWHIKDEFVHLLKGGKAAKGGGAGGAGGAGGEKKRKRESGAAGGVGPDGEPREPKKARNAVTLYLVDHKDAVKRELGDKANSDSIKARIKELWKGETPEVKERYGAKAKEDEARFEQEKAEYEAALAAYKQRKEAATPASVASASASASTAPSPAPAAPEPEPSEEQQQEQEEAPAAASAEEAAAEPQPMDVDAAAPASAVATADSTPMEAEPEQQEEAPAEADVDPEPEPEAPALAAAAEEDEQEEGQGDTKKPHPEEGEGEGKAAAVTAAEE